MPIKNILYAEFNFVYTLFSGKIDDLQVQAYPAQIKKHLTNLQNYSEIIDMSGNVDFSGVNSATLTRVGKLEQERPLAGTGPLAILVSDPLTFGLARAYSTFIDDYRTDILISYNLDDCLAFMGFNEHHKLQLKTAISAAGSNGSGPTDRAPVNFNFPGDS